MRHYSSLTDAGERLADDWTPFGVDEKEYQSNYTELVEAIKGVEEQAGEKRAWLAWAAGIFEGEGCWMTSGKNIGAVVRMTDEDVVRRFHEVVGLGVVRFCLTPSMRAAGSKPLWRWSVQNLAGVEAVYRMFEPYLGERRRARGRAVIDRIRIQRGLYSPGQLPLGEGER